MHTRNRKLTLPLPCPSCHCAECAERQQGSCVQGLNLHCKTQVHFISGLSASYTPVVQRYFIYYDGNISYRYTGVSLQIAADSCIEFCFGGPGAALEHGNFYNRTAIGPGIDILKIFSIQFV